MIPKEYDKWIPDNEAGVLIPNNHFNTPGKRARAIFMYPLWGGVYRVNTSYAVQRDYMNSFLAFSVESGALEFTYRGSTFTAGPGAVVLLDCKQHNDYRGAALSRFSYLHFQGAAAQSFIDYLYNNHGPMFDNAQDAGEEITAILDQMRSGRGSLTQNQFDEVLHRRLEHLLILLTRRIDDSQSAGYEENLPPSFAAAVDYINDHFNEDVSIRTLSRTLNTSESQLSHAFKRYLGMGVHQFVLECRISHAKHLLTTTTVPIAQISEECGFTVSSHFSSAFKKLTGASPSEFRKKYS